MKYKINLFFFIVLISFSCSETKNKTNNIKTIHLEKTKDVQPISVFVSELDYIELKSINDDNVIRQVEDIKLLDSDIIIKYRTGRETGFVRFSKEGDFLNSIGKSEDSREKILNPRDIVDYKNNYAVWDQTGIFSFSKSGKSGSKLFKTKPSGNSFFYSKNRFYLFNEKNTPGYLSEYTPDGAREHVFKPNSPKFSLERGYSKIFEFGPDSFHLFSPLIDTIFSFTHDQLVPQYVFHGRFHPTLEQIVDKSGSLDSLETVKYINNTRHWVVKTFLENKNFIFIVYQLGSYPFHLIIRKSDWKPFYAKELINDIDGGVWDDPVYLSENDELYIPLRTYQITGHKIRNKKRQGFDEIVKRVEQNGNPMIMRCKLKE